MTKRQPKILIRHDMVAVLRETHDLESDQELANAMGVDRSLISRVMRGKSQPGPRFIAGLCAALEAPFPSLFVIDEGRDAA